MTKNASIILFILVIVTMAGYLVWLNRRFPNTESPNINATTAPQAQITPSVATQEGVLLKKAASPSATLTATASSRPRK